MCSWIVVGRSLGHKLKKAEGPIQVAISALPLALPCGPLCGVQVMRWRTQLAMAPQSGVKSSELGALQGCCCRCHLKTPIGRFGCSEHWSLTSDTGGLEAPELQASGLGAARRDKVQNMDYRGKMVDAQGSS